MRQLKKLTTYAGVLAALAGGMAFAPVASAHTLTKADAEATAKRVAHKKARDPNTPYVNVPGAYTAVCDTRGVPHRLGCTLYYQTPESRAAGQWACTERIQVLYKPHNAGDPPPNYTRYYTYKDANGNFFTHPC